MLKWKAFRYILFVTIEKQRDYFVKKGPSSQGYGFSIGHVWMWELDCEESWVPKNWCFWTVVLEKTLESLLNYKEIQLVHAKGDQSWVFIGRTDAKAETPIFWQPHVKSWFIGKDPDAGRDWGQEEKGTTEDEMPGWHHRLDEHEFEWTSGIGDGQGGLACCYSWGLKKSDTTKRLNWIDPRFVLAFHILSCVTLIKSLNLSFLIWKMGTMILQPFRLHTCLQRAGGPERSFWVPESEKIWIILPPGEKEIFSLEVMTAIPKAKYWFKPNDIYLWTMTQNSDWANASVFWGPRELMITVSEVTLPQPYKSAFPCQLLLSWNHTARRVVRLLVSFQFPKSPA